MTDPKLVEAVLAKLPTEQQAMFLRRLATEERQDTAIQKRLAAEAKETCQWAPTR